jgi:hypothetical protein
MIPRYRTALTVVVLLVVYGIALDRLDRLSTTTAGAVLAQPYPGVTPTPTPEGYPGPPATGVSTATPTPTSTGTAPITLSPTAESGIPTLTPTATATPTGPRSSTTPTLTPGGVQPSPTPTTLRAPASRTPNVAQPQATQPPGGTRAPGPGLGLPVATSTAAGAMAPTAAVSPETRLAGRAARPVLPTPPVADLLPPVANQPAGPGAPLTLAVGAAAAGLVYWAWRRWERLDND